jgi:hypothetical protein
MTRQGGIGLLVRKAEPIEAAESVLSEQAASDFVLEALREEQTKRAEDTVHAHLACIPDREALALTLSGGLAGHVPHTQLKIAGYIGAASQQAARYAVTRARVRLRYLLTRPAIDAEALAKVLTPAQLETVREVYAATSFAAVARRRWPCPADRPARAWTQRHARRVGRAFHRALAKVERAGLAEQVAALRHLVANLRCLDYHAGKGRRRAPRIDGASA